jgi:5'(3')-deoxyribonucleotidase
MYRTAIEFKYIDGLDAENNIEVVKEQAAINNGDYLSAAIDVIEQLDRKYQIIIKEHLYGISKENIPFCAEKNQKYDYLIEKGIFERVYDMPKILNSYSRKEINERLAPLELKYSKNKKTEDVVEYCLQNVDEHKLQQLFSEKYLLRFKPLYIKSPRLLYLYLNRKYKIKRRLDTELPNDKATQELIKRGYYSREDVNYY